MHAISLFITICIIDFIDNLGLPRVISFISELYSIGSFNEVRNMLRKRSIVF
jgi:hypothetical protein